MIQTIWLIKMLLSHMITDFIIQRSSWVEERNTRHFLSPKLYLHTSSTALLAWLLTGWQYWPVAIIIFVTHTLIDGWKSYQPKTVRYFLIDQVMHLLVILGCWYFIFLRWHDVVTAWTRINSGLQFWKNLTAFVFLTFPAGILIGQLTRQWREKIESTTKEAEGLANAGKWIGIAERIVILIFVLLNQFSAIGLLVAAKGIIRFNEKDRQEAKTEYLVIGTLLSISLSIVVGLLTKLDFSF